LRKATGERPSLKSISAALESVRVSTWEAACASFRAAHAARTWVYDNDPEDKVHLTEDDRRAQRVFEWKRDRARGVKRGKRSVRRRKERKVTETTPRKAQVPSRRSSRVRVPRKTDSAYHWNFGDEYVEALDEVSAPTSGAVHARNAERRIRARRLLAALV
jgi:hypothetical protein